MFPARHCWRNWRMNPPSTRCFASVANTIAVVVAVARADLASFRCPPRAIPGSRRFLRRERCAAPGVLAARAIPSQAALAKELPALQGHLEQHNVHVGEISVIPESLSAGSGMMQDQHAQQQQQPQSYSRQTQSNAYLADSSANSASNAAPETSAPVWTVADGRLSVMA